ncbi:hypothetical protein RSO68_04665 [Halomonas saccharevitans]|uniref:Uncharacterized protein n=1 Tax=Halomonas saccharevitans TaxID=416872 RepID=A0A1I7CQV5_9GAMM|nr:hypothetical protein [Halomonas saccharevitans]MDT8878753.1 hypothetical protein [Halomonas saccharevitans]SFU01802.1 hypothetical protein SAMN04487956_1575 [Halomonas saccharevitans]
METELSEFEQVMRRQIEDFMSPKQGTVKGRDAKSAPAAAAAPKAPRSKAAGAPKTGHLVKLAVRTKPLEMDTVFEHASTSISKIEAQLEAEKAAKKAGYPIIGYVIETQRL